MGTRNSTVEYIMEQISRAGILSARKMFGEYALYCNGKVVALVFDEELFIKPTEAGKKFIGEVTRALPFKGAKSWYLIPGDMWEDSEWLTELVRISEAELPRPKEKKKSKGVKINSTTTS